MTRHRHWLANISACLAIFGLSSVAIAADFVSFSYEQTDKDTGSGQFFGSASGVVFRGEMPQATVSQNDESQLDVPDGMVGYLDDVSDANPGNEFGVYLGWPETATVLGERITSPTTLELVEIEVEMLVAADGLPEADWTWQAELTDDDGAGNDAFGEEFRLANFVGVARDGHRQSAPEFGTLVEGEVDSLTIEAGFGSVGSDGRGNPLGMSASLRNGIFGDDSGVLFVDNIQWSGGIHIDVSTAKVVGTKSGNEGPADLNGDGALDVNDFFILADNFNMNGTDRSLGDLNVDGQTNMHDFSVFRQAFAATNPTPAASVPEPTTGWLVLLGVCCITTLARRRPR